MLKTVRLPPSSYVLTYYRNLYEVSWLLRQEKLNERNVFKKLEKKCKFHQKISKIVDNKSIEANNHAVTFNQTVD